MNAEAESLKRLYAYARTLEPSDAEIQQTLKRFTRSAKRSRRRLRITALCTTLALLLGAVSAIAGVGPLGQIARPQAVSVVERMDQLNADIESCMAAHGATITVTGSEHAITDPGHHAEQACAAAIQAEANYVRGSAYQAFTNDQRARAGTYAACMQAAGYPVPGWNGLSGDTPSPPPTDASTAAQATCSDKAGLIRRTANGMGIASPSTP